MKRFVGLTIRAACAVSLAGPAYAQNAAQPLFAPGYRAAFNEVNRQCTDLMARYKGGMLESKLPIGDETITPAMKANEKYPSDLEAVLLREYLGAYGKCEDLRLAYIHQYESWDAANADFIGDSEKPILLSLIAKQITYGMANRDMSAIQVEVTARRKANWPKEALEMQQHAAQQMAQQNSQQSGQQQAGQQSTANASPTTAMQAAYEDMSRRCMALFDPFRNGIVAGRIPLGAHAVTPAMLVDENIPTEQEAAAVTAYAGAFQLCKAYESRYVHAYMPWLQQVTDHSIEQQVPVFQALGARRISYAEAARKISEFEKADNDEAAAIVAARKNGTTATASGQSMFQSMQPAAGRN